MDPSIEARLRGIQLLLCDVDGILTDAAVFVGSAGEFKRFSILDGLGLALLRKEGIKVGWISNRASEATRLRAEELRIDFLHQQPGDKTEAARRMLGQTGLEPAQACYMGDDIVDLGLMRMVGFAVSVPNGCPEARAAAHYVTSAAGGHGAVREIVEMILKAKNRWIPLVEDYARNGSS